MKIITFSGTDGSGKSTQLGLLRGHLENSGKRVAYFHAVEFSLANRLNRGMKGDKTFVPGREKAATNASAFSLLLRKVFLAIDLLRFSSYLRRLRKDGFDFLLSDRYFYDSIVNIEFLSDTGMGGRRFRLLDGLIPRPDRSFFLDVEPETIEARDRVPEQGLEYLKRKRALFLSDASRWGLVTIPANGTKEEVFSLVTRAIGS